MGPGCSDDAKEKPEERIEQNEKAGSADSGRGSSHGWKGFMRQSWIAEVAWTACQSA